MASKLGDRITSLQEKKDVSDEALASSMGISVSMLGQIKGGSIDAPPEDRIRSAAKTLGVSFESLQDLISDEDQSRQRNGDDDDEKMARVYESEHHDRGLLVRNVELMTTLKQSDRSELQQDIGEPWLHAAIGRFEQDKSEGRLPKLFRGHNRKDKAAPVIGRIDSLRLQNNWLVGDMLLTEPKAIEQFKRGEMPSRSAEFNPGRNFFKGLSLLEGHEGHFDDKLPELVPGALMLSADGDNLTVTLNRPIDLKETEMTKDEIVALVKEAVTEALKAQPKKDDPKKTDVEVEMQLAVERVEANAQKQVDEFKRKTQIETYVVALSRKGHKFSDNQLRRIFEDMKTDEGRAEKFKRLSEKSDDEIALEIEMGPSASIEGKLRAEYKAFGKDHWKGKNVTEDDYVRLNNDASVTGDLVSA